MAREGRTPFSGTKEIAATKTAEVLTKEDPTLTAIILKAPKANVEIVRVGKSSVGATQYGLEAGESLAIDIQDPSQLYVYGKEKDKVEFFGMEV